MKKKPLLFFLFIVSAALLSAQSIERSTIASAGNFYNVSGVQLSWTVGQPSLVNFFTNSTASLNQGFHQADFSTSIIEGLQNSISLTVYPNPSTGEFNFNMNAFQNGAVKMHLYNLKGQLVYELEPSYTLDGIWNHQIDLFHLPVGIYQCQILFQSELGHSSIKTIKLSLIK